MVRHTRLTLVWPARPSQTNAGVLAALDGGLYRATGGATPILGKQEVNIILSERIIPFCWPSVSGVYSSLLQLVSREWGAASVTTGCCRSWRFFWLARRLDWHKVSPKGLLSS